MPFFGQLQRVISSVSSIADADTLTRRTKQFTEGASGLVVAVKSIFSPPPTNKRKQPDTPDDGGDAPGSGGAGYAKRRAGASPGFGFASGGQEEPMSYMRGAGAQTNGPAGASARPGGDALAWGTSQPASAFSPRGILDPTSPVPGSGSGSGSRSHLDSLPQRSGEMYGARSSLASPPPAAAFAGSDAFRGGRLSAAFNATMGSPPPRGAFRQPSLSPAPFASPRPRIHGAVIGARRWTEEEPAPYSNGTISTPARRASGGGAGGAGVAPDLGNPLYLEAYLRGREDEKAQRQFMPPQDISQDVAGFKDLVEGRTPMHAPPPPCFSDGAGAEGPEDTLGAHGDAAGGGAVGAGSGAGAGAGAAVSDNLQEVLLQSEKSAAAVAEYDENIARMYAVLEKVGLESGALREDAQSKARALEEEALEARMAAIVSLRTELAARVDAVLVSSDEEGGEGDELSSLGDLDDLGDGEWADRGEAFRPLTEEEEDAVDRHLSTSGGAGDEIVDHVFSGIIITRGDLWKLRPGEWLNDEVVNCYMGLLQERNSRDMEESGAARMHYFNTFFYAKLTQGGYNYKNVRRWTTLKKLKGYLVTDCDKIMCPINHGNAHWTHAVINLGEKRFEFYDSMAGGTGGGVLGFLQQYIVDEFKDKKGEDLDISEWDTVHYGGDEIPQQMNGYDCGMFSAKFADFVSRNARLDFSQRDMPYFRRRMVAEILALRAE